jgi:hypothetical protein
LPPPCFPPCAFDRVCGCFIDDRALFFITGIFSLSLSLNNNSIKWKKKTQWLSENSHWKEEVRPKKQCNLSGDCTAARRQ